MMRLGFALALCMLVLVGQAQDVLRPDVRSELWVAAAVQGRLPGFLKDPLGSDIYRRIRVRGELGYRSADVFFAGRQTYLDVNLRYKISDLVSVAFEHRFASRGSVPGLRQRSILQAQVGKAFERWEPDYRFIYQHSYIEWGNQREVFRNRFQLGYNFKDCKFDPQLSVEFFTWASNQGWSYFGTRWALGTEYSFSKAHSLAVSLLNDRERDKAWPTHRWIWSFTYSLNLREI
jgi:Protein of unknown function (DUF2490)